MDQFVKSIKKENLIMLGLAAIIILFNLIGFIAAYFIWKEYRKESDYIDRNGYNLLNFHISFVIYTIIAGISSIVLIGFILTPLVAIAYFVLSLIGLFKYGSHENYNYPMTFNIIKY